jgi:hypothetical protein
MAPPQDEQTGEKEEHNNGAHNNILTKAHRLTLISSLFKMMKL